MIALFTIIISLIFLYFKHIFSKVQNVILYKNYVEIYLVGSSYFSLP